MRDDRSMTGWEQEIVNLGFIFYSAFAHDHGKETWMNLLYIVRGWSKSPRQWAMGE